MRSQTPLRAGTIASTAAAEWLKLRSVRSTWWFLAGSTVTMLLLAAVETGEGDPTTARGLGIAMAGVAYFVQFILAGLAALVITSEFATRSVLVTFACTPVRTRVMMAKVLVAGTVVALSGALLAGLCVVVVALRFDEFGQLDLGVLGHLLAIGGYLAAIAILTIGVSALVRRTAGVLAIVVALLLLVPEILGLLADRFGSTILESIATHTPAPVGYRFMAGDWASGLVLAGWAVTALALGIWALRTRDA